MDTTQNDKIASAHYAVDGKITLSSVLVLFSVVAAVIFMHAYSRYRRHRLRRRSPHSSPGRTSKHGLNPTLLAALPTFTHSAVSDEISGDRPECAVCLAEFEAGDELRSLPRCCHTFHSACIDAWLSSHPDCPLCRSPVAPPPELAEVRIAVPEPREEPVRFHEELCERKTRLDLVGLAEAGLCSPERNQVRVKCSMKRIWSI